MFLENAKSFALKNHYGINQLYDDYLPYEYHLRMVRFVGIRYKHLIPPDDWDLVESGIWNHDVIEDTGKTFNDLKTYCGKEVAELAYALSNDKGRTRKERAGDKYYEGIRNTKYAVFVKLCDRIANIEYSKMTQSRMFDMYKKENDDFILKLTCPEIENYSEMVKHIDNLLK